MFKLEASININPEITPSLECQSRPGEKVCVQGFVHRIRSLGGATFLVLRDHEGTIQVFIAPDVPGFKPVKEGFIVNVFGQCKKEERAPGGIEIVADTIETIIAPPEELPLTINKSELNVSLEVDINNRPITLRHSKYRNLFKLQEGLARGFREFLTVNGFTEIFTPKIVGVGAEGGSNVFSLDYFGRQAFLAQSPQLYKQMMVGVFGRVFEVGPVFRAEPHDTARHLNEYVSLDFEAGFINSFYDVMRIEAACLCHMFELLLKRYAPYLEALKMSLPDASSIPVLHIREAHDLAFKCTGEDYRDKGDLSSREEQLLGNIVKERFGSELVFVTHYGSDDRPFYAMNNPENPLETLSFDLLFRGVEITTGGQRIHDYHELLAKMQRRGMDVDDFQSYLMIFKYGMPPHGGLGMGLERLTTLLGGYDNIRYGSLFPRDILRLAL